MLVRFWNWLTEESAPSCKSCELLRDLLEAERDAKDRILRQLIQLTAPPVKAEVPVEEPQIDISRKAIPWAVRKRMLEENDREAARLAKEKAQEELLQKKPQPVSMETIEEVEKEIFSAV